MDRRVEHLRNELNQGIIAEDGNLPCVNYPDAYFPESTGSGIYQTYLVKQAVQGCIECPLMKICADYAIAANEEFGIWGGLTRSQRRRMNSARLRTERHVA